MSVLMACGHTALTSMGMEALSKSPARDTERPSAACLVAPYTLSPGAGKMEDMEAMLMM